MNVSENAMIEPETYLGVDRNTTGHIAVVGNPVTGKTLKLGKQAENVHKKYKNTRKSLQKKGKYRKVKRTKRKQDREGYQP